MHNAYCTIMREGLLPPAKFAFGVAALETRCLFQGCERRCSLGIPPACLRMLWAKGVVSRSSVLRVSSRHAVAGLARIVRGGVRHAASQRVVGISPFQGFSVGRSSRSTRSSQMGLVGGLRASLLLILLPRAPAAVGATGDTATVARAPCAAG